MLIRDELRALRSDDAPQRQAQAELQGAIATWRAGADYRVLETELARFGKGTALRRLPLLASLFTAGNGSARALVDGLIAALCEQLECHPLGQVPLRHSCDGALSSLMIASCGTAALVIQAVDGPGLRRRGEVLTTSFSPGVTWEHVLSGSAVAELVSIDGQQPGGAQLTRHSCALMPGMVNVRDGARESLLLQAVPNRLIMLKLQRRPGSGVVKREYRLADGRLVHQAAGSSRESRLELAASLLGRMGRKDAAPLLAAMAEEQGGRSLRWQALRECLALDTALGFSALCRIAARADDPLAAPAGALRAQLLETHPQLMEACECRV
jgi:hypothetical protein